jgi:hypothetical protein
MDGWMDGGWMDGHEDSKSRSACGGAWCGACCVRRQAALSASRIPQATAQFEALAHHLFALLLARHRCGQKDDLNGNRGPAPQPCGPQKRNPNRHQGYVSVATPGPGSESSCTTHIQLSRQGQAVLAPLAPRYARIRVVMQYHHTSCQGLLHQHMAFSAHPCTRGRKLPSRAAPEP